MRMSMRRFTRLTNAFSKKIENLRAAVSLHFAHYNFVRVHRTLRITPAMEAGVSDRLWSLDELVERGIAVKIPVPYRGIAYSTNDNNNGRWTWKLHPKLVPGVSRTIPSGEVIGTQDDAIAAAEMAIDRFLDGGSN